MLRQLIVMRHAKSSWGDEGLTDHERPLNERGRRDAPRIASQLAQMQWQPQVLLSSDARRTRETARMMTSVWDDGIETQFLHSLYLAGPTELHAAVSTVSDEVESLLVLGHNPGWEFAVQRLSGERVVMKTATAALLQAECSSWCQSFEIQWSVEDVLYPRDLT